MLSRKVDEMNRAERRRAEKKKKASTKTYNISTDQLDDAVSKAVDDAINTSMRFMFILPIKVLMDHYWQDTYEEKIPEFADILIDYYTKWQDGEYDMEELEKELWDLAGIRIGEYER